MSKIIVVIGDVLEGQVVALCNELFDEGTRKAASVRVTFDQLFLTREGLHRDHIPTEDELERYADEHVKQWGDVAALIMPAGDWDRLSASGGDFILVREALDEGHEDHQVWIAHSSGDDAIELVR